MLSHWQSLAEQAIITIYGLSEQPDTICELLLQQLLTASGIHLSSTPIATSTQGTVFYSVNIVIYCTTDQEGVGLGQVDLQVQSLVLARLLGCVGNVAQQQLVHLEVTVNKELKKQRQDEQEKTPRKRNPNHKKVLIMYPIPYSGAPEKLFTNIHNSLEIKFRPHVQDNAVVLMIITGGY